MTAQAIPFKRRAPGPIPAWTGEAVARQSTARAYQREIDRMMSFPPTKDNAEKVAELSAKVAMQLLNLRSDAQLTAKAIADDEAKTEAERAKALALSKAPA